MTPTIQGVHCAPPTASSSQREFGFDETVIRIGGPKRHLPSRRSGTMATCDRGSMRPSLRSTEFFSLPRARETKKIRTSRRGHRRQDPLLAGEIARWAEGPPAARRALQS
jgi:hypothetical protein